MMLIIRRQHGTRMTLTSEFYDQPCLPPRFLLLTRVYYDHSVGDKWILGLAPSLLSCNWC